MKSLKPVPGLDSRDLLIYPAHWIDEEWEDFASKHQGWLQEVKRAGPLYCLPKEVIDSLAQCSRPKCQLLNRQAIKAEQDLARLCGPVRAVGFSEGRFIYYPFLVAAPAGSSGQPSTAESSWLSSVVSDDEAILERLKGYVGRLVTDPLFMADVAPLSARWQRWSESQRPILPLQRFICANHYPVLVHTATAEQNAFEESFRVFCDRWLLAGMVTWDLPVPRGPVLPAAGQPTLECDPAGMLTLVVPFFYPLLGDDSLPVAIYRRQKADVRQKGLDPDLAGLTHYKAYGHMLAVAHLEQVIMNRYGHGKHPYGVVSQVEEALHHVLGVGLDQIKKFRKAISACRRGKRAGLKWLRPRQR